MHAGVEAISVQACQLLRFSEVILVSFHEIFKRITMFLVPYASMAYTAATEPIFAADTISLPVTSPFMSPAR